MLSEFLVTVEDFNTDITAVGARLANYANAHHRSRYSLQAIGCDMVSFSDIFVQTHINASMWVRDRYFEVNLFPEQNMLNHEVFMRYVNDQNSVDEQTKEEIKKHLKDSHRKVERLQRLTQSRAFAEENKATNQLFVSYKAYFFYIRAFQDACYRALLNITGNTPGRKTMNDCLKNPRCPAYPLVESIPGYIEWFKNFRDTRNKIKDGATFCLCGPSHDVGIGFVSVTPDGGISVDASNSAYTVRISCLISALGYSSDMLRLIESRIPPG